MKLRDLTYFNRSDRIVLITFLTVTILALVVLLLRDGKEEELQTQTASTETSVRNGYQKKSLRSTQRRDYYAQPAVAPTLFPFPHPPSPPPPTQPTARHCSVWD